MPRTNDDIIAIIIAVITILVFVALFVLAMLVYFNNKKLHNIREREKMLRDHEQELMHAQLVMQEQTMRNISLEIHDNVGQMLSLANLNLVAMTAYDPGKISDISKLLNKAINDLRTLSRSLNPENVAMQGIEQVLRNELKQLENTGRYKTSLTVEAEIALAPKKAVILYRMIQEIINNIIRHADATEVSATITKQTLSIADNGKGFIEQGDVAGIGMQNLRQRARIVGGTLDISTVQGKGTIVTFNLNNTLE